MNSSEYYKTVIDKIKNCFVNSGCAITIEKELINAGFSKAFPIMRTLTDNLDYLTVQKGFQVHLPVIGAGSQTVLCPMDFEIFLSEDQYKLYTNKETQKSYFKETIPAINFIKTIFIDRSMPFLLDFTPSGGHILFNVKLNHRSAVALMKIGFAEYGMVKSGQNYGITYEAMLTFSGVTRLAEYVALKTMEAFKNNEREGKLPLTVSDSREKCINIDNSWCEGAPHARSIRSPFSLHKKNIEKYGQYSQPPLVDVIGGTFDGKKLYCEADIDNVIECMWDLEKAGKWARNFDGFIPDANDSIIDFIEEYKQTQLYQFHREFDATEDIPVGLALQYAKHEQNIPEWAKSILYCPNPRALQPINMKGFIYDFVIHAKWKPKHVANILRDIYMDRSFGWVQDFKDSCPADEKANFWVRTFASIAYWEKGYLKL